jgi:outer membrane receptor protein involved in Fe transport
MVVISVLVLSLSLAAPTISGIVRDPTGAVVAGASVVVKPASGSEHVALTGPDGRFAVDIPGEGDVTVIVRAGGFAEKSQPIGNGDRGRDLEIVLEPAMLLEAVTVTATKTEQRLGDVPASTTILSREEIRQSPAVVADDVLRQIPTFSLFRRTSSLSSHPTSQGVSLRGIGPSGVSRTLVLFDGIPFNDPFGGWVYWTRVPLESADRIEVVDGSTSSLYGNYAMGGVINIMTSRPSRRTIDVKTQYGNRKSPKADFFASDVWGKLGIAVDGSAFRTDGFPIVVASERGRVDNNAAVEFGNFSAKGDYNPNARVNIFFRGGYFSENRDNGKLSTFDGTEEANSTRWKHASGGARILLPDQSDLQARVFSDFETFRSNFLAVPAPPAVTVPRSVGRMTLNQRVPTTGVGGLVQWSKAVGSGQYITAGTDWRWVDGDSQEDVLDPVVGAQVITKRVSGGTQRSVGAFVQDLMAPMPNLELTLSARIDGWRNYDAHNLETSVATGLPTANNNPALADRDDTVVNPRAAALYHITDGFSIWGDIGSGFRAPTLNELYRQFSVGAVLTLANAQLGPERLVGGEAGINLSPVRNVTVRTTWFDNRVKNPVSNVTIATNRQQRQNLGRTRIDGLQLDLEYRLHDTWRVNAGYLYNDATVREFAANPALVGKYLPQVPKHRGSFQVLYSSAKIASMAVGVQFIGRQFDDDLNTRAVPGEPEPGLPGYAIVDLMLSRVVAKNTDVFFGVQNLANREYFVGTLPTTIGSPRLVNGGVRVRFTGR